MSIGHRGEGAVGGQNTDDESGAWERLPHNEVFRQTEADTELPDLIFVVIREWLDNLPLVPQLPDEVRVVVVCLNGIRLGRG